MILFKVMVKQNQKFIIIKIMVKKDNNIENYKIEENEEIENRK